MPNVRPYATVQHVNGKTFGEPRGRAALPVSFSGRHIPVRDVMKLPLIVREPVWVKFAGRHYSLRSEGLYRFWDIAALRYGNDADAIPGYTPTRRYAAVIRYTSDVISLLSALAQLHLFGSRHDKWATDDLVAHLRRGMISMTCGPSTQLVVTLLRRLGVPARHVAIVRRGGRLNGYSDGHILVEYHCPRQHRWIMYDPVGHNHFLHRGRLLDAGEVAALLRRGGDYQPQRITPEGVGGVDVSHAVLGEFSDPSMSEYGWHHPERMKQALSQMLPLPGIARGGTRWYTTTSPVERRRVLARSRENRVIPADQWRQTLYTDLSPEWLTP